MVKGPLNKGSRLESRLSCEQAKRFPPLLVSAARAFLGRGSGRGCESADLPGRQRLIEALWRWSIAHLLQPQQKGLRSGKKLQGSLSPLMPEQLKLPSGLTTTSPQPLGYTSEPASVLSSKGVCAGVGR
jgi:hypothetical protein